jgi:hypothetical protein
MPAPLHPSDRAQPCAAQTAATQKNDSVTTATDQLPGPLVSSPWYLRCRIHDAPSLHRSCSIDEPVVSEPFRKAVRPTKALPLRRASSSQRAGSRHRRHETCLADGPSRSDSDGWRNRTPILNNGKLPFTPPRQQQDVAKVTKIKPDQAKRSGLPNGLIRYRPKGH